MNAAGELKTTAGSCRWDHNGDLFLGRANHEYSAGSAQACQLESQSFPSLQYGVLTLIGPITQSVVTGADGPAATVWVSDDDSSYSDRITLTAAGVYMVMFNHTWPAESYTANTIIYAIVSGLPVGDLTQYTLPTANTEPLSLHISYVFVKPAASLVTLTAQLSQNPTISGGIVHFSVVKLSEIDANPQT